MFCLFDQVVEVPRPLFQQEEVLPPGGMQGWLIATIVISILLFLVLILLVITYLWRSSHQKNVDVSPSISKKTTVSIYIFKICHSYIEMWTTLNYETLHFANSCSKYRKCLEFYLKQKNKL